MLKVFRPAELAAQTNHPLAQIEKFLREFEQQGIVVKVEPYGYRMTDTGALISKALQAQRPFTE